MISSYPCNSPLKSVLILIPVYRKEAGLSEFKSLAKVTHGWLMVELGSEPGIYLRILCSPGYTG